MCGAGLYLFAFLFEEGGPAAVFRRVGRSVDLDFKPAMSCFSPFGPHTVSSGYDRRSKKKAMLKAALNPQIFLAPQKVNAVALGKMVNRWCDYYIYAILPPSYFSRAWKKHKNVKAK